LSEKFSKKGIRDKEIG